MWNSTGTVSVTNGSPVVTGAGTVFSFPNAQPGQAFVGPNGLPMEIASVDSASQITLARPYGGATAAGQPFTILPTQSFANDLALAFAGFKNVAGAMLDTIGQGMFPDGIVAAPGIRFFADQDTGIRRLSSNTMALVGGGVDRLTLDGDGATVSTGGGAARVTISATADAGRGGSLLFRRGEAASGFIGDAGAALGGTETTGLVYYAYGNDPHRFYAGGTERVRITNAGAFGIGTSSPQAPFVTSKNAAEGVEIFPGNGGNINLTQHYNRASGTYCVSSVYASMHVFSIADREAVRVDSTGNLLVGVTSGTRHVISKSTPPNAGNAILDIENTGGQTVARFFSVSGGGLGAASPAALRINKDANTGRTMNAEGTINASGADYAEYVRKSLACGTILKGDVCGIDSKGELTRTWADARRYVVKSTDPNLVGGDTWAAHLGPRPEAPLYAAPAYDGPAEPTKPVEPAAFVPPVIEMPVQPVRGDGEEDEAYLLRLAAFLNDRAATIAQAQAAAAAQIEAAKAQAAYAVAVDQYQADLTAYRDAQAAHRTAVDAAEAAHAVALAEHGKALTAWEAELEAARQTVDRIAFSGQVPVNVDADTLAACEAALGDGVAVYLVAVARGAGIGVTAVREADMTLPLYMRRLGAVWAIRDGRPWVDVQHG